MKLSVVSALLVCAPILFAAPPDFTNGQAVRAIIGQNRAGAEQYGATSQITGGVSGLAVANGMLFVSDDNLIGSQPQNNRVLMFYTNQIQAPAADLTLHPSGNAYCALCFYTAANVLGQPDFTSSAAATTQSASTLLHPTGVATDGRILAVADNFNNRVLIWNAIPGSPGVAANIVLGQASFSGYSPGTSQSALRGPQGVWIQNGMLFVADTGNNRVLIWRSIPTQNNQPADVVLGQPDFNSHNAPALPGPPNPTASATALFQPISVSSDGVHVFVADWGFSRVLIWNSIPTQNTQAPNVVVGQPDFTSLTPNNKTALCNDTGVRCAATLNSPRAVISDGTRMFVADSGNDRVLIYNHIPTTNGASADIVLGQPDFLSDVAVAQASTILSTSVDNTGSTDTINVPMGLAYDGTNLYVSDALNRRVMVFSPGNIPLAPTAVLNAASELTRQQGAVSIGLPTGGAIKANDTVTITIAGTAYTYTIKDKDTLDAITAGLIAAINSSNSNAGDPNATAVLGSIPDTVILNSKGTNNTFDQVSLAASTSNPADIQTAISFGYLTGGNAGLGAPGAMMEINNPAGVNADGSVNTAQSLADMTYTVLLPNQTPGAALPRSLTLPDGETVQVYMDGNAVPIYAVSPVQVLAQLPFEYANRNSTSVYVRTVHHDGSVTITTPSPVGITAANPGLFGVPGSAQPKPALGVMHQAGNPSTTVSVDGTIQAGDVASISVNSRAYTYTVQATDTPVTVATQLVTKINSDPQVTAALGGAFARVVITARQSGAAGSGIPVTTSVTATSGTAKLILTAYVASTCCASSGTGPVDSAHPAQPNEVITFLATGLGLIQDPSGNQISTQTGVPYNGPQPNSPLLTSTVDNSVSATVNGATGQVISAGIAPGDIGVYQVQVIMPSTLPANGVAQVYIAQNAFLSNTVTIPVGQGVQPPVVVTIDTPTVNSTVTGVIQLGGWVIDNTSAISNVALSVDGNPVAAPDIPFARPDVCKAYPKSVNCPNAGWNFFFDTSTLSIGTHQFTITGTAANGASTSATVPVKIGQPVHVNIDSPSGSAAAGLINIGGWAVADHTAIASVALSVDGRSIGNAAYADFARPDVCAAYPGRPGCPNVGWNLPFDSTTLPNGTHTITAVATTTGGQHGTASKMFTVANSVPGFAINIDSPGGAGSTFVGMARISGWAFANNAPASNVAILIDGTPYGNALYGAASSIGYRPDVCKAFPALTNCSVGWSLAFDTSKLASGTHTVEAVASAGGLQSSSSASFTVANWSNNSPIAMSIDTPNSQTAVSGAAQVAGWAVSRETSIQSVSFAIDGVPMTSIGYGGNRPDVCAVFQNRPGCPNVGFDGTFDSTLLSDGTHTIAVTAVAFGGLTYTQSKTFSVNNLSGNPVHANIDAPGTAPVSGLAIISGWALSDNATISAVNIAIDGANYGSVVPDVARPDVCTAYPSRPGCPNLGWNFFLDTSSFAPGPHTVEATAVSATGQHATASKTFTIAAGPASPFSISLAVPGPANSTFMGLVTLQGLASYNGAPVDTITVLIDGTSYGAVTRSGALGWSLPLNTQTLANGQHTVEVRASANGQTSANSGIFTVANWIAANPTVITIDSPSSQTPVTGLLNVGGWALDKTTTLATIAVSVDGIAQGFAGYGGARPDACAGYPGAPGCPNVGFDYFLDTTLLADGMHTVSVTATTIGGNSSTVSKTFTVGNYAP